MEALQDAVPLRRCTDRIPAREPQGRPCALAEIGRCGAPCAGRQSVADYAPAVVAIRQLAAGRHVTPLQRLADQLDELSAEQRFEEAAARRDRLAGLVRTLDRGQGLAALAAVPELIAARPDGGGGWELAVVRHGRLAAAGLARRGVAPMPVVEALVAAAETVLSDPGPLHGAPAEEVAVVRRWLTRPGSRLVRSAVPWAEPAAAAASWRGWLERVVSARAGYPAAD
jgi:DNA polymerase-3 subunit epsilon